MEVKPGYKQTDVGIIPEEWEVKALGELGQFKNGINKAKEDFGHGFPFVNLMDVFGISKVSAATAKIGLVNSTRAERKLCDLKSGDVLFVRSSVKPEGVGLTSLIPEDLPDTVFSGFLIRYRDSGQLALEFKEYCFWQEGFRRRLIANSTVSANTNINQDALKRLQIGFPPNLPEQRAIGGALSDVDALLGALDRFIAKKRELKQAAMQQLLTGQIRLKGFSGAWELIPLMSMVKSEKFAIVDGPFGTQMKVEEYVSIGIPVIEMEYLNDGIIDQRIKWCITPKKFEELKRSAVYPGDIVISKTGSLGYLGVIPDSVVKGIITSRLAKISLDASRADRSFIFQYLLKLRRDGYWEKVSQGGTMQILGISMLQNAPIPNISVREQTAIAEVLSDMDAELAVLMQRRDKTRALKQGMMQELLTGRTRLV